MPNSRFIKKTIRHIELTSIFCIIFGFSYSQPNTHFTFTINLKGIYESKISLIKFDGNSYKQAIYSIEKIYSKAQIKLEDKDLPGQFILRFDYKKQTGDQPSPVEIPIFLGKRNITWEINPMYASGDSLDLTNDPENYLFRYFSQQNVVKRKKMEALENVILQFGISNKSMFKQVVKEYEKQRLNYNAWIDSLIFKNNELFVSHLLQISKVPETNWKLFGNDLIQNKIDHFLDFVDFNDSLLPRLQDMNAMMNRYMVMHSGLSKSKEELKDIFVSTGEYLLQKTSTGHPLVYGWMADFFYRGYEQFNIDEGMTMLKKHIDNPNCLTQKRQAIETRLKGMDKLIPGKPAPDFEMILPSGEKTNFYDFKGQQNKYKLLLFWSADCPHCISLAHQLFEWYNQASHKGWMDIIAINLDKSDNLIKWESEKQQLKGWTHIHPENDINSEVASKYAILSTPILFLINSKSHQIIETGSELETIKKLFE